ncbi:MAG: ACT domain-containing protein, partial [Stellaceae bacterium]
LDSVNMVNVPLVCKERGIAVAETRSTEPSDFQTLIRVTVQGTTGTRSVAGTLFGGSRPRIVDVEGIALEAELGAHMLFVRNHDKPGFIGNLGRTLGEAGINIATLHLGRSAPGQDAICLIQVDQPLDDALLAKVRAIANVVQAKQLHF